MVDINTVGIYLIVQSMASLRWDYREAYSKTLQGRRKQSCLRTILHFGAEGGTVQLWGLIIILWLIGTGTGCIHV